MREMNKKATILMCAFWGVVGLLLPGCVPESPKEADRGPSGLPVLELEEKPAFPLAEAIVLHGEDAPPAPGEPGRSEPQEARDAYVRLPADDRTAVVAFLKSLVTFSKEGR
jgi:Predicted thiol oxidoreductase